MRTLTLVMVLLVSTQSAFAFECNECHSKNPAMVKMHKALKGRNCFDCHRIGEKLMGKAAPKDKASQVKRRETDPICFECHKKPAAVKAVPTSLK